MPGVRKKSTYDLQFEARVKELIETMAGEVVKRAYVEPRNGCEGSTLNLFFESGLRLTAFLDEGSFQPVIASRKGDQCREKHDPTVVGSTSAAICETCEKKVKTTAKIRDFQMTNPEVFVKDLLVFVCDECDEVVIIPHSSTLKIKEAIECGTK